MLILLPLGIPTGQEGRDADLQPPAPETDRVAVPDRRVHRQEAADRVRDTEGVNPVLRLKVAIVRG